MGSARYVAFEPFCLDLLDERLWNGATNVPLGHKAFAVLARLVSRPHQLVTKDDLLAAAWPGTTVGEAVLTTAMRQLRLAIGDSARTPRFVQTVHGRGYRFIAPVVVTSDTAPAGAVPGRRRANGEGLPAQLPSHEASVIVGREAEWVQLCEWYTAVHRGTRRIGFIAGEAGIGKTTLVDAFVAGIAATGVVRICRGQCIEQYGAGEAYLPILEALGRLGRDPDAALARVLRDRAPGWLAHLPWLASDGGEPSAPARPERMLRELADALEALTVAAPLVLILEDLQWSDSATLTWLGYLARRRDAARLLVLATYRPVEALLHKTPARDVLAELRLQPQAAEIVLDYLSGEAVRTYLLHRCGPIPDLDGLTEVIHRRTGGHPLFLASIVDGLIQSQRVSPVDLAALDLGAAARTIPSSVRQFIEHQFEQLSEEDQAILEAASVAGDTFSLAAIAAGTSLSAERIEARCSAWTRTHRFLEADGIVVWPDGTLAARYKFRHALFHEAAYARISPERRVRLHDLIGSRLEAAYSRDATAIASELAVHFEQGRDHGKAVSYLEHAAQNAVHRSAYHEAHRHLVRAQALVGSLPESRRRLRREASLSLLLAQVLETTRGWGAEDVARAYARARAQCAALRDGSRLLQATWGLIAVHVVRAELRTTQDLGRDLLRLAKQEGSALFRMAAHAELGGTAHMLGQTRAAGRHFRLAEVLAHPDQHRSSVAAFGMDLGIFARIWRTHLTWYEGYPERARASGEEIVGMAVASGHPFTRTVTLAYAAMLGQFRRDISEVDRLSRAVIAHATQHGFPYYLAWAEVLRGWSLVAQGEGEHAVVAMRRGVEVLQATAGLRLPYYRALLAENFGRIGHPDEGLKVLSEAFDDIRTSDERWWEPELHRMRGVLLRLAAREAAGEAEVCFHTAIAIARRQCAKSLELRATVSLARLWLGENRRRDAHLRLAQVAGWFTESCDTLDLTEARALLEELASGLSGRSSDRPARRHTAAALARPGSSSSPEIL